MDGPTRAKTSDETHQQYWPDNEFSGEAGATPPVPAQSPFLPASAAHGTPRADSRLLRVHCAAARLIGFLVRLVRQADGRKVCLILDNLRVHHSAPVQAWLLQHAGAIVVHDLPSYSPDLNPAEGLNRSLKSKLAALPAPRTEAQLYRQTIAQLRSCHKQPALIARCFSYRSTAYAA